MRCVTGPMRPSPSGVPSTEVTKKTPPAVLAPNASSASRRASHGDLADLGVDAELARDVEHRVSRDALEHVRGRGLQDAVAHDEDVEAGALGDEALTVREHDVVAAGVVGREQRLLEVEPVVVLDARVDGLVRDALGARRRRDGFPARAAPASAIQTYGIAKQYIRLTHSRMSREPATGMPRVAIDLDVGVLDARAAHAVGEHPRQPVAVDGQAPGAASRGPRRSDRGACRAGRTCPSRPPRRHRSRPSAGSRGRGSARSPVRSARTRRRCTPRLQRCPSPCGDATDRAPGAPAVVLRPWRAR